MKWDTYTYEDQWKTGSNHEKDASLPTYSLTPTAVTGALIRGSRNNPLVSDPTETLKHEL